MKKFTVTVDDSEVLKIDAVDFLEAIDLGLTSCKTASPQHVHVVLEGWG